MGVLTGAPGRWRVAVAGIAAGVVVGGTVAVVAPAVATQDTSFAATNWKKIWKKNLQKYADKRYYTKKQSDAKYSTKAETAAGLGNVYTKAQGDAKYAAAGSRYSKAESDGRYAPYPAVIRRTWSMMQNGAQATTPAPTWSGASPSADLWRSTTSAPEAPCRPAARAPRRLPAPLRVTCASSNSAAASSTSRTSGTP